ncbi:MAG: ribonuclease HII [Balneolia bacterium]|nr:ribonuclease HII [Balneolia bacterium]
MQKTEMNGQPDILKFETELWADGYSRIIGLDEVGRGCLAGPVVAAGVVLSPDFNIREITDSKLIKSPEHRRRISDRIKSEALWWGIKECSPSEIDEHNILKASLMAMSRCVDACDPQPDYLLIDGNKYLPEIIPHKCIVGGDGKSASIGAASILAKVHRDELMLSLHQLYPWYGWDTNVGYPTNKHYEGLLEYGITELHRKSFSLRTNKVLRTGPREGNQA